ncbi:hypothetical protein [Enhygromyxa salina]|uniref:Uncharacterized protein n=1 Tax=Enhygromyxa salina TaxID=215803 RepID=A0A2S9Y499_9BACT|nr:hypothetical protein [Enhygromyxa salina]PRP99932.1 hypothetical protein ENSA7_61490 [Enhygromyxa salina]
MAVQLKIRDIQTGQAQLAEFDSVEDTLTWLAARPRFIEVLGPAQRSSFSVEDEQRLRAAMRPLDADEKAAQARQDERDAAAMREQADQEQARAREELAAMREHNRHADPNRVMQVAWERGKGCRNADPADDREVSAAAVTAVEAWVAERDTWVHPRGQYVADAMVEVWPGPVPGGDEADRVERGGQFNAVLGDPPE